MGTNQKVLIKEVSYLQKVNLTRFLIFQSCRNQSL